MIGVLERRSSKGQGHLIPGGDAGAGVRRRLKAVRLRCASLLKEAIIAAAGPFRGLSLRSQRALAPGVLLLLILLMAGCTGRAKPPAEPTPTAQGRCAGESQGGTPDRRRPPDHRRGTRCPAAQRRARSSVRRRRHLGAGDAGPTGGGRPAPGAARYPAVGTAARAGGGQPGHRASQAEPAQPGPDSPGRDCRAAEYHVGAGRL